MSLQVAIDRANSFAELRPIVEQSECKISFLGRRYIVAPNYEGTASIDSLAARVIELVNQYKFQFTNQERAHGKSIANKISQNYRLSDAQVKQQGFLIRFFVFLRSIPTSLGGPIGLKSCLARWYWEQCETTAVFCGCGSSYDKVFRYYPRNQDRLLIFLGLIHERTNQFDHPEPEKRNELVDCWR
jgi:hypothetical protein